MKTPEFVWFPDEESNRAFICLRGIDNNVAEVFPVEHPDYLAAHDTANRLCRILNNYDRMRGLAIMCNTYLEPIADQLAMCHNSPHEASMLRQLLTDARAIIADLNP